jgi:hypothetical protein
MNIISFKEAIKMVHPDSNPHITDAGEKVNAIMMYKNDETSLYKLLSNWGLLKGQSPIKEKASSVPPIYTKVLYKMWPNEMYRGQVLVQVFGLNGDYAVKKTTDTRVIFTQDTKLRTGRSWTSFNKIKSSYYYKRETV